MEDAAGFDTQQFPDELELVGAEGGVFGQGELPAWAGAREWESRAIASVSKPRILSRYDLSDGRCIEQLEDSAGRVYYRACTAGGGTCRYCEDLVVAQIYADAMCPERRA